MGLFSSSKSSSSTRTDTRNYSTGIEGDTAGSVIAGANTLVESGAPVVTGSNNRITFTDAAAIRNAMDYAKNAAEGSRDIVARALGVADAAIASGLGFGRHSFEAQAPVLALPYAGVTRYGDFDAGRPVTAPPPQSAPSQAGGLAGYVLAGLAVLLLLRKKG